MPETAGSVRVLEYDSIPMESLRGLEGAGIFKVGWEQAELHNCSV
jgi:hypothetical protein